MEIKQNVFAEMAMASPEFYEELLLLQAQELISRLMEEKSISKADLAKKLGKSKAHVTGLLADGRNLTLKTLARVCYTLGAEAHLEAKPLNGQVEDYAVEDNQIEGTTAASYEAALAPQLH
jgi:transcriptional regulator with XRE-family HTH domain